MVQNFIILGLIPGTHVQINFNDWLIVACILGIVVLSWPLFSSRMARFIIRQRLNFIALTLLIEN